MYKVHDSLGHKERFASYPDFDEFFFTFSILIIPSLSVDFFPNILVI